MGALCVLLAACSSTDSNRMSSTDGTSGSYGTPSSTSSSTADTSGTSTTMAQTSYGVVQAIDQVMRQDVGVGAVGAAAAGGAMGSPTDKVYRVKLRLDDGTEQTVVVDSMPTYQVGDRIRYSNGTVQRY
ncbi:hypothetical protein H3H36_07825 [Duganella sp. FT3S]|uniref:Uncharacterized protein n=2 Tax=Rugamonas fusca TaxID=2758568 RepID=A0A7W2EG48_9BURK|nr:hypothetical protein [Rugamonas fusca]